MTAVPSRDVAQAKADAHAAKAAVTNIFWPANIIHEGFLYGWKVQEKTICIAGVLRCESVREHLLWPQRLYMLIYQTIACESSTAD